MARTQSPQPNTVSKGAAQVNELLLNAANSIWIFVVPGALTNGVNGDGAGWAGPGSVAIRADTGNWYRNNNTKLSPTWTEMSTP